MTRSPLDLRCLAGLAIMVAVAVGAPVHAADEPITRVDIVLGSQATAVERQAATEMGSLLKRLYQVEADILQAPREGSSPQVLLGCPQSFPDLFKLVPAWSDLSEQGHGHKSVMVEGRPTLLIVGGSPHATYWAVHEWARACGVRHFLFEDLTPVRPVPFRVSGFDRRWEPKLTVRAWTLSLDLPHGQLYWGLAEHRRLIHQLAKLKFNHLVLQLPPGWTDLNAGHRVAPPLPVGGDTAGRGVFSGAKTFSNPDLRDDHPPAAAGQQLIRGLIAEAQQYGMSCALVPSGMASESTATWNSLRQAYPQASSIGRMHEVAGPGPSPTNGGVASLWQELSVASEFQADKHPAPQLLLLGATSVLPSLPTPTLATAVPAFVSSQRHGLGTLCPMIGDADLAAVVISRQSFEPDLALTTIASDLLEPVCGVGVAERVLAAMAHLDEATQLIARHDPTLLQVRDDMFLNQLRQTEAVPEFWSAVRTHYLQAMNEMYRGNMRAREGGRTYSLYLARRCEFAFETMNALEATRKAGIAAQTEDADAEAAELEKAVESLHAALNALAAVARSSSDRGLIAALNQHGYRALKARLE